MRSREEIRDFLKEMQHVSLPLVELAREFAVFAHDGQRDKAGVSYIEHPTRVAKYVEAQYHDDNLTAAAYMHDVIEDGNFTSSDLSAFFPKVIWAVVELLTRRQNGDRADYIKQVGQNLLATKIKMIDLEDNMDINRLGHPTEKDYARCDRYRSEYAYLSNRLAEMRKTISPEEEESEAYGYLYM